VTRFRSKRLLNQEIAVHLLSHQEIYEHQLELNKCKIQMLEKTCLNYQHAVNDLNRSSDHLINLDRNISTYKSIIDDLQKQNVQLETEKIELHVKCSQYGDDINRSGLGPRRPSRILAVYTTLSV
jgi:hypothetical protein